MLSTTTRCLFVSRAFLSTTATRPIVVLKPLRTARNMSNMTSSADPHSTKNKAAEGVNTVHNAGFGMGKDKPQGGTSYLNRPGVLQSIKDDHREVRTIPTFYPTPLIANSDVPDRGVL